MNELCVTVGSHQIVPLFLVKNLSGKNPPEKRPLLKFPLEKRPKKKISPEENHLKLLPSAK